MMELNELYDLEVKDFEENEELKERFIIDNPEKASWACKKINEEYARLKDYEDAINGEINILKEKCIKEKEKTENKVAYFKTLLNNYLDISPNTKKTKTQLKITTPHGNIVRTLPKWEFKSIIGAKDFKSDRELLTYCKENAPEYVKVSETVDWASLKKKLDILINEEKHEISILNKETGEFLDCITAELSLPKFEVK